MFTPARALSFLLAALLLTFASSAVAQARGGSGGIGTSPAEETEETTPGGGSSEGVFPVRGAHTYGDGLGAGRGHQGQDLLARCGKPIVAAVSGRVRYVKYQASGAGNYVVIKGTAFDTVYMHLEETALVDRGERVEAGQLIGNVGTTGRSSACHLHFEMWSKPGWYRGGAVLDPRPSLKRWDKTS